MIIIYIYVEMAEEAGVEPTGDAFAPPNGFEDRAPHRGRYSSIDGLPVAFGKLLCLCRKFFQGCPSFYPPLEDVNSRHCGLASIGSVVPLMLLYM
jgi:hypothetical protein